MAGSLRRSGVCTDEASDMDELTLGAGERNRGRQGHLGTWKTRRSHKGNGKGKAIDTKGKLGAAMT